MKSCSAVDSTNLARARRNLLSVFALPAVQRSMTLGKQVTIPLVASAAVLVAMAAIAGWPDASGKTVAGLALTGVALVGCCSAVLQSGIFSLASCLPPIYVQVCPGRSTCKATSPLCQQ